MNTVTLCQLACSDGLIRKSFGGVFASDSLPIYKNNFSSYIINLDAHTLPGSHWTAVFFTSNAQAFYFDSFGHKPKNKNILNFMKRNASMIYYNKICVQDYYSVTCGYYCLFFLYCCVRNLKMNRLSLINRKKNEIFIKNFIRKFFNRLSCCHFTYKTIQTCAAYINMQFSQSNYH